MISTHKCLGAKIIKSYISSHQQTIKICSGYSSEVPLRGASNEHP